MIRGMTEMEGCFALRMRLAIRYIKRYLYAIEKNECRQRFRKIGNFHCTKNEVFH